MVYKKQQSATILRMKKIIQESFLELLKNKKFEKITKADICEKANISSSTFYRYCQDKYDLAKQIFNSYMEEIISQIKESFHNNISECFHKVYIYLVDNKEKIKLLFSIKNDELNFRCLGYTYFEDNFSNLLNKKENNMLSNELFAQILYTLFCFIIFHDDTLNVNEQETRMLIRDSLISTLSAIWNISESSLIEFVTSNTRY